MTIRSSALLTHRQLARMVLQQTEFVQKDARAVVEGLADVGQGYPISIPVEQTKPELVFPDF